MSTRRRRAWLVGLAVVALSAGSWVMAGGAADPADSRGLVVAAAPAEATALEDPPADHGDHGQEDPDPGGPEDDGGGGQAPGAPGAAGCDQSALPLHDGEQEGQRCVPTAIGELPEQDDIPAVRITSPEDGATLEVGEAFQVVAEVEDLTTGHFNDPQEDYYATPQRLEDGQVLGHAHVVIQQLPQNDEGVPAATEVTFFQGLDEPAGEDGQLVVTVPGLEEPGLYRVQVNTASSGHQPVASPVARHVAPVDVIRVQVADADGEAGASDGDGQEAAAQPAAAPVQAQPPAPDPGDGIPPAPSSTRADAGGGGGGPAAGGGGAGDGQPPPPVVTRAPASSGPAEQPPSGYAQPVAAERGITAWVVGGGLLVFVGAGVVALTRLRRRHPRSRPGPAGYQARHLDDDDDGEDGQDQPAPAAEADAAAAAALSGELGRLNLQQPDAADRPERGV